MGKVVSEPPARSRPRGPGMVYAVISLVMILVVSFVALKTLQPPPPSISEFAPQAVDRIEDAPNEQNSKNGAGANGGANGAGEPTPTPPPAIGGAVDPINVPRVRRCVGDPPRQTEDPQSPPCVPYWAGDNGGATYKGVNANEIRIAVPANYDSYGPEIVAHFNRRYEFYGRKIVPLKPTKDGDSAEAMQTAAVSVDEELKAFGSSMYGDSGGRENVYYDELARRKLISVNGRPGYFDETRLRKFHPYEWSYLPGVDVMGRNEAEWICKALNNRKPEFAGGAELVPDKRVFGLVTTTATDGSRPNLDPMLVTLDGCGVVIKQRAEVQHSPGDSAGLQSGQNVVTQMQAAGVTTIICMCHTQSSGFYMYSNATKQGYYPEWLISTYMYQAEDAHAQLWDPAQVIHSFGLGWWSKQLDPVDAPWYQAVRETDPNKQFGNSFSYGDARYFYNSMLMLASGIQLAGPKLNPDNFAKGLQQATFPNPNAGAAPAFQGTVSFRGDHTAIEDASLVWMSRSDRSNWNGEVPGALCYANHGPRYRLGTWPSNNAGLFQRPCY